MFNKLNIKYIWLGIIVLLAAVILWFFISKLVQKEELEVSGWGGIFQKVSGKQIDSVDTSNWKKFFYEDYGYNFQAPKGWLIARTHSVLPGDESKLLGKDAKKQTLALSRGSECYLYFYPEG